MISVRRYQPPYRIILYCQREVYCKTCFTSHFDTRSRSVGPADTAAIRGDSGRRNTCPRCSGTVFDAEGFAAGQRDYHRRCMTCLRSVSPSGVSSLLR